MSSQTQAWAGLALGAAALTVAGVLLQRTLTVTLEISRYADDIADTGEGIARNTDIAAEAARLRALVAEVRTAAVAAPPAAGGTA